MEKECSHGVEWDVECLDCELIGLNESIKHHGEALVSASAKKGMVLEQMAEQKKTLNDACEGTM